ncbi:FAD-dependent monooxygenase [Lapillicoccus jejuensis]|uniref:2-polyprenyl-6-methoxyphenol hydroxylase-like FAD-dependent oxidoreductase n=1 Tax=Lapillicoccus jejuensis TaxID=402171 RepID=A0A542DYX1_9MICO|nr:FAD-dependent monooxygenase [Lapillicoccus jejuensis]TQJ08246.1 2-polyprenyl-6-methoxyphenol hydroxylase-like FAD-dependent oxidoreductase [Lapillicoccus jejuensis]
MDVVVVGAGPTGLVLAGELALAGVDVLVLERRVIPALVGTRARGFHARTVELLDQRGLAERFLEVGRPFAVSSLADVPLPVAQLPTRHPYTLAIEQVEVERLLRGWVGELDVPVRWGVEVAGVEQDADGVTVRLAAGAPIRASYVVAADGGRSTVRDAVGLGLVGTEATRSNLIADARIDDDAPRGMRQDALGIHAIGPVGADGLSGVVVTEPRVGPSTPATEDELRAAVVAVWGGDLGLRDVAWVSRFTDACRVVEDHRRGRVLVAGDAAHVHPPTGGQGLGLGFEDAVSLGWRLGQVVRGVSPQTLLDTYGAERRPATQRVLDHVLTQAFLQRGDARTEAFRRSLAALLESEPARVATAALQMGLDVVHEVPGGGDHPVVGRRLPDLDLLVDGTPVRAFSLLHEARPLLLDLGGAGGLEAPGGIVRTVRAQAPVEWELPVVGAVPAPGAVLVRPDGHVAWAGDDDGGLAPAVTRWCGTGPG